MLTSEVGGGKLANTGQADGCRWEWASFPFHCRIHTSLQSPAWPCYAAWWDQGLNSLSLFLSPTSLVSPLVHQLETLYSYSCLSRSSCGVKLRIAVPLCSCCQSKHLYSHVPLHVGSADFPLKSDLLSVLHGPAAFVPAAENKLPGFQLLHLE